MFWPLTPASKKILYILIINFIFIFLSLKLQSNVKKKSETRLSNKIEMGESSKNVANVENMIRDEG